MVENAIQTGRGAAKNILKSIRSQKPEKVTVKMHGTMVSVGNFFAVSDIMGRELPVWLSIIMKFMVNIHYLWEITGFWGVARYLYHELLERRQRKLIIEQHWSTRIQAWWLVPVRLFLGWVWLYEGIKKIGEGWFLSPKLATFFGYANSATDAATSATPTADAAAEAATNAVSTIKTLFHFDFGFLKIILEKTSEMIFRIDFAPVNWFVQHIVLTNDTTQMVFQIGVVVAEIALGLALLSGTFTFLAALASIALTANFILTTGIYEKTWWMIFAAIACMGGAGRAFGVDYYLIPYLNNVWEYLWKNHRLSLIFRRCFERPE
jgi:NADH dehydrogenase